MIAIKLVIVLLNYRRYRYFGKVATSYLCLLFRLGGKCLVTLGTTCWYGSDSDHLKKNRDPVRMRFIQEDQMFTSLSVFYCSISRKGCNRITAPIYAYFIHAQFLFIQKDILPKHAWLNCRIQLLQD